MKNYYDELEISKNASKEVIERVYKVLAKKYHPDTTQETDKHAAEEKFKIISEAYEVLSNDEKRKKYDLELEEENPSVSYDDYMSIVNQRDILNNSLDNLKKELEYSNNYKNINYKSTNNTNHNCTTPNPNYKNTTTTKKTKNFKYYNIRTGKPVSAFTYYKYKIKQFFSNLFIFILAVIAILLAINSFLNLDFFNI